MHPAGCAGLATSTSRSTRRCLTARRTTSSWVAGAAVPLIAVGAAAAFAVNALRSWPDAASASPVHFEIPVSIQPRESVRSHISPDSKRLVFIGTGADGVCACGSDPSTRSRRGRSAEPKERWRPNSSIFWSPDSQTIGFYADGAVRKISRRGRAPGRRAVFQALRSEEHGTTAATLSWAPRPDCCGARQMAARHRR